MTRTRIFYDSEFTGPTSRTTLITIALATECGAGFYAEFTDYDRDQVDDFVRDHVLAHSVWLRADTTPGNKSAFHPESQMTTCVGDSSYVTEQLATWLGNRESIQIWADHVSYDWVMFCQLFGGALHLPANIHYIPMDLCTFFECHGYDSDCNRAEFAADYLDQTRLSALTNDATAQHNAWFDAVQSLACYRRIVAETSL